jgi:hypothetical protein
MGGNLCGVSTGEALSRSCAAEIGNNALSDFATAPTWVNDGMQDYVDQTEPTDRDPDSTGCGMAFLSWLISQGHPLNVIAPAMVSLGDTGTLAQLYANLTGDDAANAWPNFIAAVQAFTAGVTSDDPFGGAPVPQMANLDAPAVELAAKIFSFILSDLSAGRPAQHTVASVRAMMNSATARTRSGAAAVCKSHRLVPPGAVLAA